MHSKTNTQNNILNLIKALPDLSDKDREQWCALVSRLNKEQLSKATWLFYGFQNQLTKLAQDFDQKTAQYSKQQQERIVLQAKNKTRTQDKQQVQDLLTDIGNTWSNT